jgi:hypothetical protein
MMNQLGRYTSLGDFDKTVQNSALLCPETGAYLPAYQLADYSLERVNRKTNHNSESAPQASASHKHEGMRIWWLARTVGGFTAVMLMCTFRRAVCAHSDGPLPGRPFPGVDAEGHAPNSLLAPPA